MQLITEHQFTWRKLAEMKDEINTKIMAAYVNAPLSIINRTFRKNTGKGNIRLKQHHKSSEQSIEQWNECIFFLNAQRIISRINILDHKQI